jgi:two-component system cell cycle response regulator
MWILLGLSLALAIASSAAAIHFRRAAIARAAEVEKAREAAMTDSLTGVLNRRGFIDAAERELKRAQRYGHPLAFAFVDVRGLKAVNDTRGHSAGDRLLRGVATLLTETSRSHDIVGRIGGDELALLLAEQSIEGVAAVGRRLKAKIPQRQLELGLGQDWDLTVGIAIYPSDGKSIPELLATADRRLYLQRGIRLRQPVALAAGQRALQAVDHRDGGRIDAAQDGQVERDKVAQHHE